jgi:hypothetical protein
MNYDIGQGLTVTVNETTGAVSWSSSHPMRAAAVVEEIQRRMTMLLRRHRELAKLAQAIAISDRAIEEAASDPPARGEG